jgi:hypothetical protein
VGALTLAGRRANAVGAVRVTLMPGELEIELLRVTGFAQGFAPGGVAEPVTFRVPYTAVRGLVREGRVLYLAFDPAVVTPYNRFALAGFTDDAGARAQAWKARARARWASRLLPAPGGALAAALVPEDLVAGVLGRASLGVLVALVLFAALRELAAWRTWGGPRSDRLRDLFEAELAERLALVPAVTPAAPGASFVLPAHALARRQAARVAAAVEPPAPIVPRAPVSMGPQAAPNPGPASRALPPSASPAARLAWPMAAAIAAAVGIVGVMVFLQRFAAPRPPPPAVDRLLAGLGAAARGGRLDVRAPPEPERCVCTRADSPLWKDGVPTLALLTFHGDDEASRPLTPTLDHGGHPGYDFDLAVVNDGARPLREIRVTLTFARRDRAGRRVGAVDRGLFWAGVLAPGAAVKWRVSAPGSEMRVDASVTGTLAAAHLDPAPADAFFRLLSSRFRAVRVHGAAMLAYLRDPRADAVVRAMEAQGSSDEALLSQIRRAAAPVFACDVRRAEGRLDACLFNASSRPRAGLALREVAAAPRAFPIEAAIPVHEGRAVAVAVPDDLGDEIAVSDPSTGE